MVNNNLITVEVAYAREDKQTILSLDVAVGTTLETAIQQSGILTLYPEIDLAKQGIGIFSKPKALSDKAYAGCRIEIYRPLRIDPKAARRAKAIKYAVSTATDPE